MNDGKKYIGEKAVSELTGIACSTLRKFRFYGKEGPAYIKIGRSVRYALEDVYGFMDSRRIQPRQ